MCILKTTRVRSHLYRLPVSLNFHKHVIHNKRAFLRSKRALFTQPLFLLFFFRFGCSIASIPIFHHHFRCETRNMCNVSSVNVPLFRCLRGAYGDPATLRGASHDIPSGLSVPARTHIAMCTLKTTRVRSHLYRPPVSLNYHKHVIHNTRASLSE